AYEISRDWSSDVCSSDLGIAPPVLVLTTFDDDELVLQALRAGARGYLLKDVTLDQLVGAIRTLADGGTLVQPNLTDRIFRAAARSEERRVGERGISRRWT